MSVENLKEYVRRCATEPELRATAKTIGITDTDEHMRHAGSLGLDWTMDDMVAFRKEALEADGEDSLGELSHDEMERIAGGVVSAIAVAVGVAAGVAGGVVVGTATGAAAAGAATATAGSGW